MSNDERRQRMDRAALPVARGIQTLSWMVVGLCIVLMAVGFSVSERRTAQGPLPFGEAVYAQAEGAEGEAKDAAPETKKDDAAAEKADAKQAAAAPDASKLKSPMREAGSGESWMSKAISFLGIFAFIFLAWCMSNNRKKVDWKLVAVGTVLQLIFAALIFWMPFGREVFDLANGAFTKLLAFTDEGSRFIFGAYLDKEWSFALKVLPTIVFFSSLMTILYHLGIMQIVVKGFAWLMQRLLGTSGAETLSASANIFVGQTEAPLMVKPFLDKMTKSELMTVMTGGFATVAGGVLAAYVGMLSGIFPDIAGHLIAASVMSAPAALVIGKIMYPETEVPETMGELKADLEKLDDNIIEAAARGAGEGLTLALNVGAMLLAFLALIAMLNYLLGAPSYWYNAGSLEELVAYFNANKGLTIPPECVMAKDTAVVGCIESMKVIAGAGAPDVGVWHVIKLQEVFGVLFWPIAFLMGVPFADCYHIGQLLGTKMVLNEFVAYIDLSNMLKNPEIVLSRRSVVIATYALCGFANFGSIAIQIGGLGGIAPSRKKDLARLGLRAMIAGSIAAFMTATIAGILI